MRSYVFLSSLFGAVAVGAGSVLAFAGSDVEIGSTLSVVGGGIIFAVVSLALAVLAVATKE